MKRPLLFGASALLVALPFVTGRLEAQTSRVWIEPRLGWVTPTRDLGRTDILEGAGYGTFERVDPALSLGIGAGLALGDRWGLRFSGDRSMGAPVSGEWRCAPFAFCPDVLLPLEGEMERWSVGLDALYRPTSALPVDVALFGGVGYRRNHLSWGEPSADVQLPAFEFEEGRVAYRLGAGLERSLGAISIFGEAEALASNFGGAPYESIEGNLEGERQTTLDVSVIGGFRIRLR